MKKENGLSTTKGILDKAVCNFFSIDVGVTVVVNVRGHHEVVNLTINVDVGVMVLID